MNLSNKILYLIITIIIFFIILYIYGVKIASVSIKDNFVELQTEKVKSGVEIYVDNYNIPQIIANNELDAFFAIGYLHSKDRLWQMELFRRFGRGELAEIFGEELVYVDKFSRGIGFLNIAKRILNSMNEETKLSLTHYIDGINFYLDKNSKNLPFEFNTLNFIPKKWQIIDCITISRVIAFIQSGSFNLDIAFAEIAEKIGVENAHNILPHGHFESIYQMDSIFIEKKKSKDTTNIQHIDSLNKELSLIYQIISNNLLSINELIGKKGSSIGSNSWVIKKHKNKKSGVVLANDPHMEFSVPATWYQVQVNCPEYNVIGGTIPGSPFVLVGRNENISWGMTNLMLDDVDYFIEKIDSTNKDYYINSNGTKIKFDYKKDTIKVKGKNDEVYYLRSTKNSNVISDFHLIKGNKNLKQFQSQNSIFDKYCLTFSWTGSYKSDELTCLYKINKSKDWEQFLNATSNWGSPGIVFAYADRKGNYGLNPSGFVPIRKNNNPQLPSPSWLAEYQWEGVRGSHNLPKLLNPSKGFVVSANNKLSRNLSFFLSNYTEPESRANRISNLLFQHNEYNYRDAQIMQNDLFSSYSNDLLNIVIPLIEKDTIKMNITEKNSFYILKYWDNILTTNEPAGAIYSSFLTHLIKEMYLDELGDRVFYQFTNNSSMPLKRTYELLKDTVNYFIDNITTKQIETKEDIILLSFKKSIEELTKLYNNDNPYQWTYGKIHQLTLEHKFSANEFFRPAVTLGPFEVGGDVTTINNFEYNLNKPYNAILGASIRFIADMEDSVVYSIIPGGASGEPLSNNFSDQVQLFLNGGYIKHNFNKDSYLNKKKLIFIKPK